MAIAHHWSPSTRRASIRRRDLIIGARPAVDGVEDNHRSPWISLAPTAALAWWMSSEALESGGFTVEYVVWDLWEVDLDSIEHSTGTPTYPETTVASCISADRLTWLGTRVFGVGDAA
jgi:hypothetical protein